MKKSWCTPKTTPARPVSRSASRESGRRLTNAWIPAAMPKMAVPAQRRQKENAGPLTVEARTIIGPVLNKNAPTATHATAARSVEGELSDEPKVAISAAVTGGRG
jgi:hypothetical protein